MVLEGSFRASGMFKKDADPANLALLKADKTLVPYSSTAKMQMTLVSAELLNYKIIFFTMSKKKEDF